MDLVASPLTHDLPCIECGYNLRGLDPARRCPECGADISRSRRGDLLRFANREWLQRVRRGLTFMYYGLTFSFLVGFGVGLLRVTLPSVGGALAYIATFAAQVLLLFGVFLTTSREPRESLSTEGTLWLGIVRLLAAANLILALAVIGAVEAGLSNVAVFVQLSSQVVSLVMTFGYFSCAQNFAPRIPDQKLGKATRSTKWGLSIANGIVFSVMCLNFVSSGTTTGASGPNPFLFDLASVLGLIGGLMYIIYLIRGLRVLLRFRKALKSAIADAQAITEDPGLAPD